MPLRAHHAVFFRHKTVRWLHLPLSPIATPAFLALAFWLTASMAISQEGGQKPSVQPIPANPTAEVPECVPGKLSAYEKLGPQGCRIGDIRFSDFSRSKTSNGLLSRAMSLTPGTAIDSTDPALLLEGPWLGKPQPSTVTFTYKVSAMPPAKPVIAASLQMQFGQVVGTGQAGIDATLHPSGPTSSGVSDLKLQLKVSGDAPKKDSDEGDLASPATELRVTETVTAFSGKDGSARLNGFMTVFQLQGVKSGAK